MAGLVYDFGRPRESVDSDYGIQNVGSHCPLFKDLGGELYHYQESYPPFENDFQIKHHQSIRFITWAFRHVRHACTWKFLSKTREHAHPL